MVLEGVADKERRLSGQGSGRKWDRIRYDTDEREKRDRERAEEKRVRVSGKREEGQFSIHDRRVKLTVGHTLILDLQVLIGPWAGVREDI